MCKNILYAINMSSTHSHGIPYAALRRWDNWHAQAPVWWRLSPNFIHTWDSRYNPRIPWGLAIQPYHCHHVQSQWKTNWSWPIVNLKSKSLSWASEAIYHRAIQGYRLTVQCDTVCISHCSSQLLIVNNYSGKIILTRATSRAPCDVTGHSFQNSLSKRDIKARQWCKPI